MLTQHIISSKMIQQATHTLLTPQTALYTHLLKSNLVAMNAPVKNNFLSPPYSLPGEGAVTNFCVAFVLLA